MNAPHHPMSDHSVSLGLPVSLPAWVQDGDRLSVQGQRSSARRLSVLLLCDDSRGHANTVRQHIAAFKRFSRHDVRIFNPRGLTRSYFLDLDEFDVVVIHYSLVIISDHYLAPAFREQIRRFSGLKMQFIQDEYRWVDDITDMMRYLGIHVLWTLVPPAEIPKVYDDRRLPGVRKIHTLGGYVPDDLGAIVPPHVEARPIDIGYRGRTLPYWLGTLAQEKVWIAQGVLERAERYSLRCDLAWAEEDRIYGRRWNRFLSSCKTTLGTESGASISDFDGSVERRTKAYLAEHPDADFCAVYRDVLQSFEGNVKLQVVSPRVFEAAALRTGLILFPGEYSGVVQPWIHYIPLAKDFSNMDEVVKCLRDAAFLRSLTERAYVDLVASGRYSLRRFIRDFDDALDEAKPGHGTSRKVSYQLAAMARPVTLARQHAVHAAEPVLRIPRALVKVGIAAGLLWSTKAGRAILFRYLSDAEMRSHVSFKSFMRDILKLAVVGQSLTPTSGSEGRFRVSYRFESDDRRLLFLSHRLNGCASDVAGTGQSRDRLLRGRLESAFRDRRLRTVLWDHSAVRGEARLFLPWSAAVKVFVGEHDLHRFESLPHLGMRLPAQMSEFLCEVLAGRNNALPGRS